MIGVEKNARTVAKNMESDNRMVEKVFHETAGSAGKHHGNDIVGARDTRRGRKPSDNGNARGV